MRYEARGKEVWDLRTDSLVTEFATGGRHVGSYVEALNIGDLRSAAAVPELAEIRRLAFEEAAKVCRALVDKASDARQQFATMQDGEFVENFSRAAIFASMADAALDCEAAIRALNPEGVDESKGE